MARIKGQEVIRRLSVASRETNAPDLTVQADLDSSRGHNALGNVAAGAINRVSDVFTQVQTAKTVKRNEEDQTEGAAKRMEDDLNGDSSRAALNDESLSKHWRRGYLKTDAALRVRDWQREVMKEVAQLEPGEDVNTILQPRTAELLNDPLFADPEVRKALLPALQRSTDAVKQARDQSEINEIVLRQQESLTALIGAGFEDQSLDSQEKIEAFYEMVSNNSEYGYMHRRDIDAAMADAALDVIEKGGDPEGKLAGLLSQKRPDGTPGVFASRSENGVQYAEQLENARAAGDQVIRKRQAEEMAVREAQMEDEMTSLVSKARLTPSMLRSKLAAMGYTPDNPDTAAEYISRTRYWTNQQEAEVRRREAEARQAAKDAEDRKLLAQGNWFALTDDKVGKLLQAEYLSHPPGSPGRGQVLNKAMKSGVPIPFIANILQRSMPGSENWKDAAKLYHDLKKMNPEYAARHVNDATAGAYETYYNDVYERGFDERVAVQNLQIPKDKTRNAESDVSDAWKGALQLNPTLAAMNPDQQRRVREQAARNIAKAGHYVPATDAILAATGQVGAQYATVKGVAVPRITAPVGSEPAIESFVDAATARLVAAGRVPKGEEHLVTAAPNPHKPSEWVVLYRGGVVEDPADGTPFVFGPRAIAQRHRAWEDKRAEATTKRQKAVRDTFPERIDTPIEKMVGRPLGLDFFRDDSFEREHQDLVTQRDNMQSNVSKLPANSSARARGEKQLAAIQAKLDKLNEGGKKAPKVPADFIEYLNSN